MRLEVGKTYVAADGSVYGPMSKIRSNPSVFVVSGSIRPQWNKKGVSVSQPDSKSSLVAERITPTLWRDMSAAEKGALLLAQHEDRGIEVLHQLLGWVPYQGLGWVPYQGSLRQDRAYRIKPEPKVVKHYWTGTADGGFAGTDDLQDTHMITFNTVDGEPDLSSIKMEKI